MPIQNFAPAWMTEEHQMVFDSAKRFMIEQWQPKDEAWRAQGMMDRQAWEDAGANGFLCASMPEQYGGGGGDFGHEAALVLAQGEGGIGGSLHSGIVAPYILHYGTEEQKKRWLPKLATGELISAIAMTEPGTGSDLQGVRTLALKSADGESYTINGSKTFITNGQLANLIIVVCKTDKDKGAQGISLFVVETDEAPGFRRGRNLDKIGMEAQDTSELFFDDVVVSKHNLIGEQEGKAFGKPIFSFQNTRFKLAECQALLLASRALVDAAMVAHLKGELGVDRAALIKYWITDNQ